MIYVIAVLSLLLAGSVFYCVKFGLIILRVQDSIEEALDVIDEKYASISEVCERPLFYDSPEVRKVLEDIKGTRSSLHNIALSLYKNFEAPPEEEKEETPGEIN